VSLQSPTKAGYEFTGWAEGAIAAGSTGAKTLTATWRATAYPITYVLGGGGVNHTGNPATYTIEDSVVLKAPSRKGYNFAGWVGDSIIRKGSTGAKMFTAKWSLATYRIAYELGGGVNHADNPAAYTIEDVVALQSPTKTGYEFTGWKEGDKIVAGSTGDKTFTAQWKALVYSISYELNGGANHADNPASYTIESSVALKDPSKTGYDFTGWTEGSEIAAGNTGDKTFTATWKAIVYNIVYELAGGANHADNPASYTIESSVALKDPSKTGYRFEGWIEGSEIAAGSTGDRTFTATWKCTEANIETISIDGVDIANSASNGVFAYTPECGKSTVTLTLTVSPQASIKVNGQTYSSSGQAIAVGSALNVTVEVTSETNDTKEYTLKVASLIDGSSLYYSRWDDVLAINRNPDTNNGYTIAPFDIDVRA
jgi:uncharacterized repeat protein (TIGR02543 family)